MKPKEEVSKDIKQVPKVKETTHHEIKKSSKKIKKVKRILPKKERLERLMKKLVMDLLFSKIGKQRKAKLDAVKAIKQLYLNLKNKTQMFIDGRLIYI